MKIATWNIGRPRKGSDKMNAIIQCLKELDADILVLTETIDSIDLGSQYRSFHTAKPAERSYRSDERRVSIYSKYDYYEEIETFRSDTSICVNLDTPLGPIAFYGTMIGTEGSNSENFKSDLALQIKDFDRIGKANALCICGELNTTFSDNYCFTEQGRSILIRSIAKNNLVNLTAAIPENTSHIIMSKTIENNCKVRTDKWNISKTLGNHKGISATMVPFD